MCETVILTCEKANVRRVPDSCEELEKRIYEATRNGFRLVGPVVSSPIGRDVILTATLQRNVDPSGITVRVNGTCPACEFKYPNFLVHITGIICRDNQLGNTFDCHGKECTNQLVAIGGTIKGSVEHLDRLLVINPTSKEEHSP